MAIAAVPHVLKRPLAASGRHCILFPSFVHIVLVDSVVSGCKPGFLETMWRLKDDLHGNQIHNLRPARCVVTASVESGSGPVLSAEPVMQQEREIIVEIAEDPQGQDNHEECRRGMDDSGVGARICRVGELRHRWVAATRHDWD